MLGLYSDSSRTRPQPPQRDCGASERYTLNMKLYVLRFRTKEPAEIDKAHPHENVEVEYSDLPLWVIPVERLADIHCLELNRLGVRVATHQCSFEVEKVPGGFAIACPSHPPFRAY